MIIVAKADSPQSDIDAIEERIRLEGLKPHRIQGEHSTIVGVIGSCSPDFREQMEMFHGVERVIPIDKPYKLAARGEGRPSTKITVANDTVIGGESFVMMAGPCTIESREQLISTAEAVKRAGATVLRGGAYKPRSSPYSFQGLAETGLNYLEEARIISGLPVITEVMDPGLVETVSRYADILQVGARNCQNFPLLNAVGQTDKPVMLKRGAGCTTEEWIMSAEYIMSAGNARVMMCERGIRTLEDYTRNTLDLSAIPVIKRLTHLPVIFDPSHSCGRWHMVKSLTLAGIAAGADGALVEVHPAPNLALCD
ncbi:MAG: 3-deoxy-7-phosphoheptulonate synthase, partial [Gammaproteobacteria bacterium]|nr:3-deoxy-7-phosphoheptulonate synthase [Gammaproteobacteria bacterium]